MSWGLNSGPTLAKPGIYALLAIYITSLETVATNLKGRDWNDR
jgi:hypothetical protein